MRKKLSVVVLIVCTIACGTSRLACIDECEQCYSCLQQPPEEPGLTKISVPDAVLQAAAETPYDWASWLAAVEMDTPADAPPDVAFPILIDHMMSLADNLDDPWDDIVRGAAKGMQQQWFGDSGRYRAQLVRAMDYLQAEDETNDMPGVSILEGIEVLGVMLEGYATELRFSSRSMTSYRAAIPIVSAGGWLKRLAWSGGEPWGPGEPKPTGGGGTGASLPGRR